MNSMQRANVGSQANVSPWVLWDMGERIKAARGGWGCWEVWLAEAVHVLEEKPREEKHLEVPQGRPEKHAKSIPHS